MKQKLITVPNANYYGEDLLERDVIKPLIEDGYMVKQVTSCASERMRDEEYPVVYILLEKPCDSCEKPCDCKQEPTVPCQDTPEPENSDKYQEEAMQALAPTTPFPDDFQGTFEAESDPFGIETEKTKHVVNITKMANNLKISVSNIAYWQDDSESWDNMDGTIVGDMIKAEMIDHFQDATFYLAYVDQDTIKLFSRIKNFETAILQNVQRIVSKSEPTPNEPTIGYMTLTRKMED